MNLDSLESRLDYMINVHRRAYQTICKKAAERRSRGYDYSELEYQQQLLGGKVPSSYEYHVLGHGYQDCRIPQAFVAGIGWRIKQFFWRLFHGQIVHLHPQYPYWEYKYNRWVCQSEQRRTLILMY